MYSLALCVQAWPFYKCSRISLACNRHSTAVCQSVRLSAFIPWLVLCVVSPLSHWPLGFAVWAAWKGVRVRVCVCGCSVSLDDCVFDKLSCFERVLQWLSVWPISTWSEYEFLLVFQLLCQLAKRVLRVIMQNHLNGNFIYIRCQTLIRSFHLLITSVKLIYFMRRPHKVRQDFMWNVKTFSLVNMMNTKCGLRECSKWWELLFLFITLYFPSAPAQSHPAYLAWVC